MEMERITELGRSAVRTALDRVGRGWSRVQERRPLAYDVLESDDAYLVVFDAPGVDPADVQVQFSGRTVEVRLDRFREFREGFEMRFPGRGLTLAGTAELPEGAEVTPAGAQATLTHAGTLQVEIPKSDAAASAEASVSVSRDDRDDDGDGEGDEGEGKGEDGSGANDRDGDGRGDGTDA